MPMVEAVAWVQGRVDLLSAAGVLVAILLGLAGTEASGERRPFYWMASATWAARMSVSSRRSPTASTPSWTRCGRAHSRRSPVGESFVDRHGVRSIARTEGMSTASMARSQKPRVVGLDQHHLIAQVGRVLSRHPIGLATFRDFVRGDHEARSLTMRPAW